MADRKSTRTINHNWRHETPVTVETIAAETVFPVDSNDHRNPIIFHIRPIPGFCVDTKNIKLVMSFTARKEVDGAWVNIEPADRVTLYNGPAFSLFEDVHLSIGGTTCETAQREYSRTSFLQNMLFTDKRQQKALQSALFLEDNPLFRNAVLKRKDTNMGEAQRSAIIEGGKIITTTSPIYLDVFQAGVPFPDHVSMTLRMYPARSSNCVLEQEPVGEAATTNVKVVITNAIIQVPRYKLTVQKSMKADYECVQVLNYLNPKSLMSFSKSLNTNQLPKKLAVVILSEDQYHGLPHYSGHYFHHHNVSNITVQCNGNILPALGGLNIDAGQKHFHDGYNSLYEQLHSINPLLDLSSYDNGNAIFGINLQPGGQPNREKKPKFGQCDIEIQFSQASEKNLIILIFCYYDSSFSIDKNGIFQSSLTPKLQ